MRTSRPILSRTKHYFQALKNRPLKFKTFWIGLAVPPVLAVLTIVLNSNGVVTKEEVSIAGSSVPTEERDRTSNLVVEIERLNRSESYLKSRLELASRETISLSLDLADSVLLIELRGVPLRKAVIFDYDINELERYAHLNETLFTLESGIGTVPQIPIRVVRAPSDTLAAAQTPVDIPIELRDTRFRLTFDKGLILDIKHPPSSVKERFRGLAFDWKGRIQDEAKRLLSLLNGEVPERRFVIELTLSADDAKAVYRSQQQNAAMAVRF